MIMLGVRIFLDLLVVKYIHFPVSKGKPIELIYLITHPILWLWLLYGGKRGFKIRPCEIIEIMPNVTVLASPKPKNFLLCQP